MTGEPTTWKITPAGATEEMIEAGLAPLRDGYFGMKISLREAIRLAWIEMSRASPAPPPIEETFTEPELEIVPAPGTKRRVTVHRPPPPIEEDER
jgi:hypothetical protein